MTFEDLPENYDFERLYNEHGEMYGILSGFFGIGGCQQDEKGDWIVIRQLTPQDLNRIKSCLDNIRE